MSIISCTYSIVAVVVSMSQGIMGIDVGVGGVGVDNHLYILYCRSCCSYVTGDNGCYCGGRRGGCL